MSALAAVCCASARVTKRSSSSRTRNGVGEKSHDGRTASARMDVSISTDDRALIIVQERKKGRKEENSRLIEDADEKIALPTNSSRFVGSG